MDVCWYLAEIAKVFWYDRHPRLRKGRPSVPQVLGSQVPASQVPVSRVPPASRESGERE